MAGAAIAAAFTTLSVVEGKKAEKEQKKAKKEERAAARSEAVKQKKMQLREARISRAQAVNQAAVTGGEGTILDGATASATQQAATNIGHINTVQGHRERAFTSEMNASKHAGKSSMFGAAAGISANFAGGGSSLFKSTPASAQGAPISESTPWK